MKVPIVILKAFTRDSGDVVVLAFILAQPIFLEFGLGGDWRVFSLKGFRIVGGVVERVYFRDFLFDYWKF
jgi:hypothetical protein